MLFSSLQDKSAITVLLPTPVFVLKGSLVRDIKRGRKAFLEPFPTSYFWSGREDLNPRPCVCGGSSLSPVCLISRLPVRGCSLLVAEMFRRCYIVATSSNTHVLPA